MNKWVLITGATQGIGHEFTRLFAVDGYHLALVARDGARLSQIAAELGAQYGVRVKTLVKDLSFPTAPREIFDELQREQIPVSILVNNAGFGSEGYFAELDLKRHLDLMQVNMTALVELTHWFVKPMLARREGRVLNVGSTAGFMPGPLFTMYFASKAFVYSFSRALGRELEGSGVTVTVLCPGLTRTQFHARAGMYPPNNLFAMDAATVAKIGYGALMLGKPVVVPGWVNRAFVTAARFFPARMTMWAVGSANREKLRNPRWRAGE